MEAAESTRAPHLDHPALLYRSTDEFVAAMVPYLSEGLDQGEVVFVATRADNVATLRGALGDRAEAARLVDTDEWHPHPASRLRAFHEFVTDEIAAGATRFRLAGEPVWPEEPPEEIREWQRYESVLNRVLAPFPATLVCLYDAVHLDPSVVDTAKVTHPALLEGTAERPSRAFEEPEEFLSHWNEVLSPPPASAERMPGDLELSVARRFLEERAKAAGLGEVRSFDLCVAANEILTNAVSYAPGVNALWTWEVKGRFVCQIEDRGQGIADPLAGYRPPTDGAEDGRGLWLARQLVDLLQIVASEAGTTVRLHVRRP